MDLLNALNDDQFALLEPLRYDNISALFGTRCDASLLDLFCLVDHHDVMTSLVEQYGGLRHHERLTWCTAFHNDAHDTAWNKQSLTVWQLRAHRYGIGVGLHLNVKEIGETRMWVDGAVWQFDMNGQMRVLTA